MKDRNKQIQQVLSSDPNDAVVCIHQDAWFNLTNFEAGKELNYSVNKPKKKGGYLFVLNGKVTVSNQSVLTLIGGHVVFASREYQNMNPKIPEVLPNWSPVKYYGWYQSK